MPEPAELGADDGELAGPVGVTRIVVSIPGTASIFCPKFGTQKEWITSTAVIVNRASRPTGSTSSPDVDVLVVRVHELPRELLADRVHLERPVPGLAVPGEHDGAHDPDRDHEDRRDRRPRDLEPRVTVDRRAVGVVVQRTRHFQTEKTTTAATSEKITIEITVANQ